MQAKIGLADKKKKTKKNFWIVVPDTYFDNRVKHTCFTFFKKENVIIITIMESSLMVTLFDETYR